MSNLSESVELLKVLEPQFPHCWLALISWLSDTRTNKLCTYCRGQWHTKDSYIQDDTLWELVLNHPVRMPYQSLQRGSVGISQVLSRMVREKRNTHCWRKVVRKMLAMFLCGRWWCVNMTIAGGTWRVHNKWENPRTLRSKTTNNVCSSFEYSFT